VFYKSFDLNRPQHCVWTNAFTNADQEIIYYTLFTFHPLTAEGRNVSVSILCL